MVRARITTSIVLAATFIAVHAAAAATLIPLGVAIELKLGATAAIATSLASSLWRYALVRAASSVVAIEVNDRGSAAVLARSGDWQNVEILGTTYVTPSLTVVNVRPIDRVRTRHVLLVADNIDAEDFRAIRVLLRWARPDPEPAS